jgi:hypothetical protein
VETVPPGMRHMRWENLDHVSRWSVPRALAASATELRIALDDRLSLTHRGLNGLIRQQVEGVLGRSDVVMEAFRAAHGPRSCEGAALAMVEARLVLAMMLKRFEFTSVPGPAVTPIERFVLWAAEDITMSLTPRGS